MIRKALLFFLWYLLVNVVSGQKTSILGFVVDEVSRKPIEGAAVAISGFLPSVNTTPEGYFVIEAPKEGEYILRIHQPDYHMKQIPIVVKGESVNLGVLFLEKEKKLEPVQNEILLSSTDFVEENDTDEGTVAFLSATRDIFLGRAAFDFGQAFFRIRGYDSAEGEVLLNGFSMNGLANGRPQWNNWGGLNDVIRNQESAHGLAFLKGSFGNLRGTNQIDLRPSKARPGIRISASSSNRTYAGRLMATYNSGELENGISYTFSSSRRWANEGYIDGTLYDAYSFYGAAEYALDKNQSIALTAIAASNRRGRSTAITDEVFELAGRRYNPNWGFQNGAIRNAREGRVLEPIFMLNHFYEDDTFTITSGISYQFGRDRRSRLGFFNAPNPDPTFFRFLPSFYINNPFGADFTNASLARQGFQNNPQLDWPAIATANVAPENAGKAAYILYDDAVDDRQFRAASQGNIKLSNSLNLDFGVSYSQLNSSNFAELRDLLGANFHEDIDVFSNTRNNLASDELQTEGDTIIYNYQLRASRFRSFAQLKLELAKWNGFIAAQGNRTSYARTGLFQNERFLESSLGSTPALKFADWGIKNGIIYTPSGRHQIEFNGLYSMQPPILQNVFINPRESSEKVPDLQLENRISLESNYRFSFPKFSGRFSTFYTYFENTTDVNFFFVDSGLGSDFVQEVLTNLDRQHLGLELGLKYQLSSTVTGSLAMGLGRYTFASNPNVSINFDTAGAEEDLIDPAGNIDLGTANITGLRAPQGPQTAVAVGIEYRDPKYWWIGASANYLADNFIGISTLARTPSFLLNPDTGLPFPEASPEAVANLLQQQSIAPVYLMNLVGGKSWLINGKYISLFLSANNLFDTVFKTGGFEQSRNGNFGQLRQDNLSGTPSFGPRFWYGFGRSYFLNLAVSF